MRFENIASFSSHGSGTTGKFEKEDIRIWFMAGYEVVPGRLELRPAHSRTTKAASGTLARTAMVAVRPDKLHGPHRRLPTSRLPRLSDGQMPPRAQANNPSPAVSGLLPCPLTRRSGCTHAVLMGMEVYTYAFKRTDCFLRTVGEYSQHDMTFDLHGRCQDVSENRAWKPASPRAAGSGPETHMSRKGQEL